MSHMEQQHEHTYGEECPACEAEMQAVIDGVRMQLNLIGPDAWRGFVHMLMVMHATIHSGADEYERIIASEPDIDDMDARMVELHVSRGVLNGMNVAIAIFMDMPEVKEAGKTEGIYNGD